MKIYKIPVNYQSVKNYEIKAENLQEAIEVALKQFFSMPDENYLEDTFEIDGIIDDENPNESYDLEQILDNL